MAGIATFPALTLDNVMRMVSLRFTASALSVVSSPFTCHGAADTLRLVSFVEGDVPLLAGANIAPRPQV